MPDTPEWLTVEQAAEWLQVSTKTIRRYIEAGTIPAVNLGGRAIRIRRQDLETWLETRRVEPGSLLREQAREARREAREARKQMRDARPRFATAEELARVNVSLVQADPLQLRCNTCGTQWMPKMHAKGRLGRREWCCPQGCIESRPPVQSRAHRCWPGPGSLIPAVAAAPVASAHRPPSAPALQVVRFRGTRPAGGHFRSPPPLAPRPP